MTNVDTMTVLVLASRLGDRQRPSLPPGSWHSLVAALGDVGMSPDDLVGRQQSLVGSPPLPPDLVSRIQRLVEGAGAVTFEYEEMRRKGISAVTVGSLHYPERLNQRLGGAAPPVLFVVGDASLLSGGGAAIVGSRNVNPDGAEVAKELATSVARAGLPVVSGGARGVDQLAMNAAFKAGGAVVGVLADSLLKRIKSADILHAIDDGTVCLLTQQHPETGFSPAVAMGRNKLIYALADATVVVATDEDSGGTWAGATEALSREYGRVAVWRGDGEGPGNAALERRGAAPIRAVDELARLLAGHDAEPPDQLSLLG
jgi:predicted Rossmann fold nucleotide-binding protein DprA/Smf involved in DNA uptake